MKTLSLLLLISSFSCASAQLFSNTEVVEQILTSQEWTASTGSALETFFYKVVFVKLGNGEIEATFTPRNSKALVFGSTGFSGESKYLVKVENASINFYSLRSVKTTPIKAFCQNLAVYHLNDWAIQMLYVTGISNTVSDCKWRFSSFINDELMHARSRAALLHDNYVGWKDKLDVCPCKEVEAANSPRFKDATTQLTSRYHPGAERDYRTTKDFVPTFNPNGTAIGLKSIRPGQQCTYDKEGALITEGPGAGTPDAYAPSLFSDIMGTVGLNDESHYYWDVQTFEAEGMTLQEYHQTWTPNNGNNCKRNRV